MTSHRTKNASATHLVLPAATANRWEVGGQLQSIGMTADLSTVIGIDEVENVDITENNVPRPIQTYSLLRGNGKAYYCPKIMSVWPHRDKEIRHNTTTQA